MTARDFVELIAAQGSCAQSRFYDYLLAHGSHVASVDWERSEVLASRFRLQPKQCYFNAQTSAMRMNDARYMEGWAAGAYGVVVEHAWLVVNDVVVDPTWARLPGSADPASYFGIEIDRTTIAQSWLRTERAEPLLWRVITERIRDSGLSDHSSVCTTDNEPDTARLA